MLTAILIVCILILLVLLKDHILMIIPAILVCIFYPIGWVMDRIESIRNPSSNTNGYIFRLYGCYECGGFNGLHHEGCSHFKE